MFNVRSADGTNFYLWASFVLTVFGVRQVYTLYRLQSVKEQMGPRRIARIVHVFRVEG